MAEDPRRVMIEVFARLGRETQIHLDERHRHFRITDTVIIGVSILLAILAIFNVYYVHILYQDLSGIVSSMDSMHGNLLNVRSNMVSITDSVDTFEQDLQYMDSINSHMVNLAGNMPLVGDNMHAISNAVGSINGDMGMLGGGMTNIEHRVGNMTGSVAVMRENVRQISGPMGFMNPMMP